MTEPANEPSWSEYYRRVAARPPRPLLIQAAELFPTPGLAIDLGSGGGIETRELLRRGWEVVAVDQEPAAFEYLTPLIAPEDRARFTPLIAPFATLTLPAADLIWAGLSVPFCHPDHFDRLWHTITGTLRPGGRFAGDLFGVRHAWRNNVDLTFLSREQVEGYLQPYAIELLEESEELRPTAFQGMQPWHGFAVIARKLADAAQAIAE